MMHLKKLSLVLKTHLGNALGSNEALSKHTSDPPTLVFKSLLLVYLIVNYPSMWMISLSQKFRPILTGKHIFNSKIPIFLFLGFSQSFNFVISFPLLEVCLFLTVFWKKWIALLAKRAVFEGNQDQIGLKNNVNLWWKNLKSALADKRRNFFPTPEPQKRFFLSSLPRVRELFLGKINHFLCCVVSSVPPQFPWKAYLTWTRNLSYAWAKLKFMF